MLFPQFSSFLCLEFDSGNIISNNTMSQHCDTSSHGTNGPLTLWIRKHPPQPRIGDESHVSLDLGTMPPVVQGKRARHDLNANEKRKICRSTMTIKGLMKKDALSRISVYEIRSKGLNHYQVIINSSRGRSCRNRGFNTKGGGLQ